MRSIQTNTMIFMSDRLSVAFSFSRRAHLLTTCKAGGGIPPVGQARALFTKRLLAAFPEGQAMSQANIPCAVGSIFCTISKTMRWHIATPSRRLPAKTCHRQLLRSYRYRISGDTHFLFSKEKQKERTVKTNGNLSSGSKSSQPWYRKKRCCSFRLSELF